MSTPVVLHPLAVNDLADGVQWYEASSPGLGDRFEKEVKRVLERIGENPRQYGRSESPAYRRAVLRVFPFCIYYAVEDERVTVMGVQDGREDPARIKRRLG